MGSIVVITRDRLQELHDHNILPRYNAKPPSDGVYGWLREGMEVKLRKKVVIEENVGLYGGQYKPFRGGRPTHGFATIGSFCSCASPIPEDMVMGRYCGISTGLKVIDSSHPIDTITTSGAMFRVNNNLYKSAVTPSIRDFASSFNHTPENYPALGNDVWIGANVTLAPNITIGTGAVVATGSVVTRDVPPYAIVGGNPAKFIRYRFSDELIARLLSSRWWDYNPQQVFLDRPTDIERILSRIEGNKVEKYCPRSVSFG